MGQQVGYEGRAPRKQPQACPEASSASRDGGTGPLPQPLRPAPHGASCCLLITRPHFLVRPLPPLPGVPMPLLLQEPLMATLPSTAAALLLLTVQAKARTSAARPCLLGPTLTSTDPFCPPYPGNVLQLGHPPGPLATHCLGSLRPTCRPNGPWPYRCTPKGQCGRAAQANQWLWSYEDGHCPHVQSLLPAHRPRQEQGQVSCHCCPPVGAAHTLPPSPSSSPAASAPTPLCPSSLSFADTHDIRLPRSLCLLCFP